MEKFITFLDSIHPLSKSFVEHLKSVIKVREVKKRRFLVPGNAMRQGYCFVQEGLLRCFNIEDKEGRNDISMWFMKEGDIIYAHESFEAIQALEDCVLLNISWDDILIIYRTYVEFSFIERALFAQYFNLSIHQLQGLKMRKATERYEWLLNNHPDLLLRVPAKYLASYLGLTEETFSRVRNRWYMGSASLPIHK